MADELKVVLSRYGYMGSIASLAGTGNKRIQAFIKLIVEELKSCNTLTGEAKENLEELNRLSKELSREDFRKVLKKREDTKLKNQEKDEIETNGLEERAQPLREQLHTHTLNHIHRQMRSRSRERRHERRRHHSPSPLERRRRRSYSRSPRRYNRRCRGREREYSYSPSPDRRRGSKRPKREKKHRRRSPSATPSLSPPPKRSAEREEDEEEFSDNSVEEAGSEEGRHTTPSD